MKIEIWTSLYANPRYTDEPGCSYHGELNIQMPDTTGGKKREIGVKMIFGKTELEVRALKTPHLFQQPGVSPRVCENAPGIKHLLL
jgi:hypothetical protein